MKTSHSQPVFVTFLAVLFFMFAVLACNAPDWVEVQEGLELPTPGPTIAPSPEPGEVPASPPAAFDQTFQGLGRMTSFGSSADVFCQVDQPVTLTVHSDGSAELSTTGPSFIDHINCTTSTDVTWYINGTVGSADQSAIFTSCNNGGFTGTGEVSFEGGILSGDVTCSYKNGGIAISLALGR
jgi:hypothetical protein